MSSQRRRKVFKEDSVLLIGERGLVVSSGDDSDEDPETGREGAVVLPGFAKVSLLNGSKPRVVASEDCQIVDRAMALGDIVRRDGDEAVRKTGTVIGVDVALTLEAFGGSGPGAQFFVPASAAQYAKSLEVGMLVTYKDWVGEIEAMGDTVAILIPSTSAVVIPYNMSLLDPDDGMHDESHFALARFTPGQRVRNIGGAQNLRNGTWLRGDYTEGCARERLVIAGVKPTKAEILWTLYNSFENTENLQVNPPPERIDASLLTPLNSCFEHCSYLIGDTVILKDEDITRTHLGLDASATWNTHPYFFVLRVVETRTTVTVQWQDSTETANIPSTELVPCLHLDENEFWPTDYVSLAQDPSAPPNPFNGRTGMVTSVNPSTRTAAVRWFDVGVHSLAGPAVEYSVYELRMHADMQQFRVADRVVLTEPACAESREWFGEVVKVGEDGRVRVRFFGGGEVVDVSPKGLIVYEEQDQGDEDESYDDEEQDEDMMARGDDDRESDEDDEEGGSDMSDASWATDGNGDEMADGGIGDLMAEEDDIMADSTEALNSTRISGSDDNMVTVGEWIPFKSCDTAPQNHRYYNSGDLNHSRIFHQRIRKEYSILMKSLPQGILVRVYEDRLDLLRVLMVGPAGTPYEGALFLFDVSLPTDYPNTPPNVFFHSWGGGRMNPNLYEDGKVCLSLLGTWSGVSNENWRPAASSLLQVFVSIHSLVLTREPYYNEPGYENQQGTEEGRFGSIIYNERVYLLMLRSVEHVLMHPPVGFENEVKYHFAGLGWLKEILETAGAVVARSTLQGGSGENGGANEGSFPIRTASIGCVKLIKVRLEALSKFL
ncbi:hypothetical protein BC830DRAFT_1120424 [Chytriomyces sp. MP71]|nr:hypothetical protein BC830DRAFT_1120424 [Chytriomyces sp. MP71]